MCVSMIYKENILTGKKTEDINGIHSLGNNLHFQHQKRAKNENE